ncbi:glyoxylase-like metal-dependent hydrolase (beta-lactamase superfamily II) [Hydrogenivirga caldilitoris]|uniref:Glyoxylase-like metal-dependent hydrolase (Beta-lactamase superfamily II) n=1 Tax=Hydrogenivirga caldilitoris TaxID=246264 RepID=A0A497XTN5_9AQUI|nr:MBL fold metallo-hydrolase [Hydrogenivirga caldilitoris]RLJ71449.1 glyoxylase-like metal-dependent hydrolase (beta-lactamase superfamily II) [Hydrogenivirga caldilitoris]
MRKVLLLLPLLLINLSFSEDYPKHVKETLKKIKDNVYGVFGAHEQVSYENRGFISNAYFVITKDGVLVVDALTTYKLGKELVETIRSVTDKPIKFAVITHYHTDHFYGVGALKEVGSVVIAHEWAYDYVSQPSSWNFYEARKKLLKEHMEGTQMVEPDITITRDLDIHMGRLKIEVRHFCKAHTPGDIIAWIPALKVLFSGDIVFDGRLPFLGSGNSKSWLVCLEKILELDPDVLLPGHGSPMLTKDRIRDRVRWTYKYIDDLRKTIRKMVEEGQDIDYVRENINDALLEIDPSYAQVPVFFDVNPVNAYYVYFEVQNELLEEGQ